MIPTVLVLTTVHWAGDTRIRERLIRSLAGHFDVIYAAKPPAPSEGNDHRFVPLRGGRVRRNLAAVVVALRESYEVVVLHDPELVPLGLLVRLLKKKSVVFDVHEDFPAVARTRSWVPPWAAGLVAALARLVLRLAERFLTLTLAESGYAKLFVNDHVVFPNLPDTSAYPDPEPDPHGPVAYLGDITPERGSHVIVSAAAEANIPIRMIGPVSQAEVKKSKAALGDVPLAFEGRVSNPEAISLLRGCSVGLSPLLDLPNYRHSQPTKILEYLAMGLPVVASDLPGTRSLVEGLQAVFLFEPGDHLSLAGAMRQARTDLVVAMALDQAAYVRDNFSWPRADVVEFYASLV